MLSKHKRPYDAAILPPDKRLSANVRDIFATNQLSGIRTQELINDIADAGVPSFKRVKKTLKANVSRNLKNTFLKRNLWPSLYWAKISVKNLQTGQVEKQWCAFILPHEYLQTIAKHGLEAVYMSTAALDPKTKIHVEQCEAKAGCKLLATGLWCDGIPCNWDRTESVETFTLNLPGQDGAFKSLRLPITAISRKQLCDQTWDDILEVIAWSFQHAAAGTKPAARHDDTAFLKSDWKRKKDYEKNSKLLVRACLAEVRGDWKMFGETFKFPKWNTKKGCCWLCNITPDEVSSLRSVLDLQIGALVEEM